MQSHFHVPGITCQGCAKTIDAAVGALPGVSRVSIDVPAKHVTVEHGGDVARETLEGALAHAGYPAADAANAAHPQPHVLPVLPVVSATVKDPVCGMDVIPESAAGRSVHDGTTYYFCSPSC